MAKAVPLQTKKSPVVKKKAAPLDTKPATKAKAELKDKLKAPVAPKPVAAKPVLTKKSVVKTAASKPAALKQAAPKTAKAKPLPAKRVNSVLITQPKPDSEKSPYYELARKYNLNLEFHPFILVEGVPGRDFRRQRVDISEFTAIVLTSRNAVDHFFRICEELKVKVSQDMKYFCITEAVALYLQKFILYRKRKVFFSADGSTQGLLDVIGKHKVEKYILPTADNGKNDIHQYLAKYNITFAEVTLFHTVANNIDAVMKKGAFDLIVFFSPFSVQTLFSHNPKFKQNGTVIGAFGPTTAKAVEDSGMKLDVKAPAPNAPSMVSALENYLAAQAK